MNFLDPAPDSRYLSSSRRWRGWLFLPHGFFLLLNSIFSGSNLDLSVTSLDLFPHIARGVNSPGLLPAAIAGFFLSTVRLSVGCYDLFVSLSNPVFRVFYPSCDRPRSSLVWLRWFIYLFLLCLFLQSPYPPLPFGVPRRFCRSRCSCF